MPTKLTTEEFILRAKEVHGEKYDYNPVIYVKDKEKVKIYCNSCKKYFWQSPNIHLRGSECQTCTNHVPHNTQSFIKKAKEVHGNFFSYEKSIYKNCKEKVIITCPIHGGFKMLAGNHLRGQKCPKCKRSKGEIKIYAFLKNNSINHKEQKRFSKCRNKKPLPFDFYLPDYNLCIEYDGEQHFNSIEYFGGKELLKLMNNHDKIKTKFCEENNITLLRIPYWELKNIDSILKNSLNL